MDEEISAVNVSITLEVERMLRVHLSVVIDVVTDLNLTEMWQR